MEGCLGDTHQFVMLCLPRRSTMTTAGSGFLYRTRHSRETSSHNLLVWITNSHLMLILSSRKADFDTMPFNCLHACIDKNWRTVFLLSKNWKNCVCILLLSRFAADAIQCFGISGSMHFFSHSHPVHYEHHLQYWHFTHPAVVTLPGCIAVSARNRPLRFCRSEWADRYRLKLQFLHAAIIKISIMLTQTYIEMCLRMLH